MTVVIDKHITIDCIENVVLTVGIVSTFILRMEAKAYEFIMDLLCHSQTSISNKRLYQNSTDMPIPIFCKSKHRVSTIREIFVVCFYSFKKWCKIIVRISKIIQFDDFRTIIR